MSDLRIFRHGNSPQAFVRVLTDHHGDYSLGQMTLTGRKGDTDRKWRLHSSSFGYSDIYDGDDIELAAQKLAKAWLEDKAKRDRVEAAIREAVRG